MTWSATALGLERAPANVDTYLVGEQSELKTVARLVRPDGSSREYPLPFLPHAFVTNPFQKHIVFTSEANGTRAAVINLRSGAVQPIDARTGRRFSGHAAWHPNGLWIYATQMNDELREGQIAVISTSDWTQRAELATGGMDPQSLSWEFGTSWLIILNSRPKAPVDTALIGNGQSSLVWMDLDTGGIVNRRFLANQTGVYNHFVARKDRSFILAGSVDTRAGQAKAVIATCTPDGIVKKQKILANGDVEGLALTLDERLALDEKFTFKKAKAPASSAKMTGRGSHGLRMTGVL